MLLTPVFKMPDLSVLGSVDTLGFEVDPGCCYN